MIDPDQTGDEPDDIDAAFEAEAAEVALQPEAPAPAPAEPVQPPPVVQAPQEPADHRVPLRELLDERERRQRFEREAQERQRELEELRKAAEKPAGDPLDLLLTKPDEWGRSLLTPLQEELRRELRTMRQENSRDRAVAQHGADSVKEACAALDAAIARGEMNGQAVEAQLGESRDMFGEIIAWHKRQRVMSEVGSDPDAYKQRLRDEIRAELEAERSNPAASHPGQASAAPSPTPLPSLNRAVGNAGNAAGGSISEEDIFNAAPAFGRRKA